VTYVVEMELPETKWILVGIVAAVVVVAFVGGFFAGESQTTMEGTVVTSQSGEVPESGDELVLVVAGETSRLSEVVGSEVERLLTDKGYTVTVDESMTGDYDSPVLIIEVVDETVETGLVSHRADVSVLSYYSTTGNTTQYERFKETRSTMHREPGAVVAGEYWLRDTTSGVVTPRGYRNQIAETLAEEVVSSYRGAINMTDVTG